MTTVNKNQPQPPAAPGNGAHKPQQARSADAEVFWSCLRQSVEHCSQSEEQRVNREQREGKRQGQGQGQGQSKDRGGEGQCGQKKKQCEKQPKQGAVAPVSESTPKPGKQESFGEYVTRALRDNANEVEKRTSVLGNTNLEDPGEGDGKKLSMEEYATKFGEDFVDNVVDYRMKEFYGEKPVNDGKTQKTTAHENMQAVDTDKAQSKTSPSAKPSETRWTPVPAKLAVKEPGVPTKTGIAALDRWDAQFSAASKSTGLPANYLKAVAWAQSRGNPDEATNNPDGKHVDLGVMQISDYTYSDVLENQPGAPRGLRASDPDGNIMMAAWELRDKFARNGRNQSYEKTSAAYRGAGDGRDLSYGRAVVKFWSDINEGKKPSDNGPW
jgi:ribosomal protein L15